MSGFRSASGIKISLGSGGRKPGSSSLLGGKDDGDQGVDDRPAMSKKSVNSTLSVAEVFNDSDDSEPEEMPAEARIRMRNIGKQTPTSAGPNSFGKTSRGFTDRRAALEKQLREQLEKASEDAVDTNKPRKGLSSAGLSATASNNTVTTTASSAVSSGTTVSGTGDNGSAKNASLVSPRSPSGDTLDGAPAVKRARGSDSDSGAASSSVNSAKISGIKDAFADVVQEDDGEDSD